MTATWRTEVTDDEVVRLTLAHDGWWDRVRTYSLGWAVARDGQGALVGFVNVAWDGGRHAFLLDTAVAPEHRRRGVATALVGLATERAREAGCEWVHVDFEQHLSDLYLGACGFRPTLAGLIRVR